MDTFDGFEDKEFDQLNEAVLKAILSSKDVEKVLRDFKSKDLINEMAVVNLILSLEDLSSLIFSESAEKSNHALDTLNQKQPLKNDKIENKTINSKKNQVSCSLNSYDLVDGKNLSCNEILFEKYYQERFNEKQWLQQSKIKL
ncbi:MAG: hypothetical protein ACKVLF_06645 [Nitrospinaceae bacterium]